MSRSEFRFWNIASIGNVSRAWFVTEWAGKYAGVPDAELLFTVLVPHSQSLCAQLFPNASVNWEFARLVDLARVHGSPEVFVTDHSNCTLD
jgi:hypothetical protein